jgi:hypothetical protein
MPSSIKGDNVKESIAIASPRSAGRGPGRMAAAQHGAHGAGIPAPFRPAGEGRRHDDIDPGHGWYRHAWAARSAAAARRRRQRDRPQPPPREAADGIRYTAGDLSTGAGIEAAVRGAEVIVHCAGSSKGDEQKARTLAARPPARGTFPAVVVSVIRSESGSGFRTVTPSRLFTRLQGSNSGPSGEAPAGVPLDRHQWIAFLPARPDRRGIARSG